MVSTLYLIRSYDHEERTSPGLLRRTRRGSSRPTIRSNTGKSGENIPRDQERGKPRRSINYGNAQEFQIWEVARAATAAPLYFEPLKIEIPGNTGHLLFTDGGFNYTNNPTAEGTREIEDLSGSNSIGVVVSIGTARRSEPSSSWWIMRIIQMFKAMGHQLTDPEVVHGEMERKAQRESFHYYRL